MVDTPESNDTADHPDSNLPVPDMVPQGSEPPNSNEDQKDSKQSRHYAKYVVWPFKALGRWFMRVVNWLDKYDGAVTAAATIVIAVLTGYYVYYAKQQWGVMKGQLIEMKQARIQAKTDDASAITAQQAIAQTSLKTSQDNFAKSSQGSESAFRDEQRAWIGITSQVLTQFEEHKPVVMQVNMSNTGKTPARKVKIRTLTMVAPTPIPGPTKEQVEQLRKADWVLGPAIPPQGQHSIHIGKESGPVTDENRRTVEGIMDRFNFIKSKTSFLYNIGEVSYEDVSGRIHLTTFCVFLADPDTKFIAFCSGFNEIQ
jgi:hypothetical protein